MNRLNPPLSLLWRYDPAEAPRPAWPESPRIQFDYGHQPVMADGLVLFGSTVDDTVRALDAATGEMKWTFTADGPVRFAPHVAGDLVYVASDDGFLYCLDLASGKLKWRFCGGLRDDRVIGNGRMISRWPLRTGVLVDRGAAYITAGLWPSEGIYIWALNADTGEVIWCNDTSGCQFLAQPHDGAYALTGITPQGYLAASDRVLIIPTGRGLPVQFDRKTGRRLELNNQRMINRHTGEFFPFHGSTATVRGGTRITVVNEKGMFLSGSDGDLYGFSLHGRRVPTLAEIAAPPYPLRWIYLDQVVATEKTLFGASTTKMLSGLPGEPLMPDRAGELILAGNVLVAGGRGFVQAYEISEGRKVLDAKLDGEVRGLAVADGRLVATTLEGTVYCFGPRAGGESRRIRDVGQEGKPAESSDGEELARMMTSRKTTKGFALVVNPEDARIAEVLARQTDLHVIALMRDKAKVDSEQRRLLESTALYGSRVVVHHVKDFARLPLCPYFANLVVVAGEDETLLGSELYRLLRPCGGVMCFLGTAKDGASTWIKEVGVPAGEVGAWRDAPLVARGKLPGAFDWDSETKVDKRVRWPLEVLWFGKPGPAKMADRHWRPHTPVPANGRYFVIGRHHIIAVDAYNGTVLWEKGIYDALTRNNPAIRAINVHVPVNEESIKSLHADDEHVTIDLGGVYARYDAQTGEEEALLGDFMTPEKISLEKSHVFHLAIDEKHKASIEVSQDKQGLKLVLRTVDPDVTAYDAWELFFDFRRADQRFGFYGKETFHITTPIGTAVSRMGRPLPFEVKPGAGAAHPQFVGERAATDEGVEITLALSWDEMKKLCGDAPSGFGFSATLVSNDVPFGPILKYAHLAGGEWGRVMNAGWPNLFFGPVPEDDVVPLPRKALARPLDELPETARTWSQRPPDILIGPHPEIFGEREHPITCLPGPKSFRRGYGCRNTGMETETMLFFRSGTLGSYDFADDSGLRNFGGIRPGCGGGLLPALGLFIASESSSGCGCSYNFQTTVVLAPAPRRSNEDWALFADTFPAEDLKRVSLNLGAPGDRRADEGTLWLGFPRACVKPEDPHANARSYLAMEVPVSAEGLSGFGPDRGNADRVRIGNTQQPWIYTSCYRGLKTMRFGLRQHSAWISLAAAQPPVIDGDLSDSCWREVQPQLFTAGTTPIYLRHDKENMYVAFRQSAGVDADGNRLAWKKTIEENDGDLWKDDAFELYITDGEYYHPKITPKRTKACVHLGVSASGATYDALYQHSKMVKDEAEDKAWNATWSVKVKTDEAMFHGEFAIPWKVLSDAGVTLDAPLHIVAGKHLGDFWSDFWAWRGFRHVSLDEGGHKAELYTVRLHFAEPDDVREGQRVLDVALQGKAVARDVDIIKEAGGRNRALIREFKDVAATRELVLELSSRSPELTPKTVPLLSGIEVFKQNVD